MHKSATKCIETLGKWCKNKHGASKIIDTLETYHGNKNLWLWEQNLWLWEQNLRLWEQKIYGWGKNHRLWEQIYGCGNKNLWLWEQKHTVVGTKTYGCGNKS
jgi:hypothetical protein